MASFPWNAGTPRTTGIASETVAAGANFLGSEIDNSSNLDTHLDLDVAFTCGSAPTANKVIEIYLLFSVDGTNYEDGDATPTDPTKSLLTAVAARAVTSAQRVAIDQIPIPPKKFKILIKSELDQSASVTVLASSYRLGYAA